MIRSIYRFRFDKSVPMEDVEKALALSTIAVESIYGESAMRLDGMFGVDKKARVCTIDRETDLGRDLARVLTGFLKLSITDGSYAVEQDETDDDPGDMFALFKGFIR